MHKLDPQKMRSFAVDVVRRLREHGYEAYWAGGCVRDHHLKREPYDYDVATSAQPAEICHVFHDRRTLAIGAAFGVITVVGPRGAGQIEVTTFREDVAYSDGRHPDAIAFSSAEEDAKRRDFTINGMFYDPLAEKTIDFVGGQEDLKRQVIRAIGNPRERFTEDKLRMLRAVRFAAIFNFEIESETAAAIREMAPEVTVVSAERIAAEMRILMVHPMRVRAMTLLRDLGLLRAILPELAAIADADPPCWERSLTLLEAIESPSFPLAAAALLGEVPSNDPNQSIASHVGRRWKLSRKEIDSAQWLMEHADALRSARERRWSEIQPLLITDDSEDLVKLHNAAAKLGRMDPADVEFCRQRRQLPKDELNPAPLVEGRDLIEMQIPRGPIFSKLLKGARDAQLDGAIRNRYEALDWVRKSAEKMAP